MPHKGSAAHPASKARSARGLTTFAGSLRSWAHFVRGTRASGARGGAAAWPRWIHDSKQLKAAARRPSSEARSAESHEAATQPIPRAAEGREPSLERPDRIFDPARERGIVVPLQPHRYTKRDADPARVGHGGAGRENAVNVVDAHGNDWEIES
jgi:hypothetical protein